MNELLLSSLNRKAVGQPVRVRGQSFLTNYTGLTDPSGVFHKRVNSVLTAVNPARIRASSESQGPAWQSMSGTYMESVSKGGWATGFEIGTVSFIEYIHPSPLHVTGLAFRSRNTNNRNRELGRFILSVSNDGVTYTPVITETELQGVTEGQSRMDAYFNWFDVTARYFKIQKTVRLNATQTEITSIQDLYLLAP